MGFNAGSWGGMAGVIFPHLSGEKQTYNQEAMLTDEQKQAMATLSQLSGQDNTYNLSGFDFGLSNMERTGGTALENLMASGTGLDSARNAYEGILGQTFNPDDPSNEFASFNRQLSRQVKSADDVLNRESAITGGRFGTGIQRQKTDLAVQQSDIQGSKLAELYTQLQNRKLSAAGGLTSLAGTEEAINQNRIQAAYQYGTRERDLQNQKAQLAYDDWTRARTERLSTLTNIMNKGVDYGMKSYTDQGTPSLLSSLVGAFGGIVGSKVGAGQGSRSQATNNNSTLSYSSNSSTPYTSSVINL